MDRKIEVLRPFIIKTNNDYIFDFMLTKEYKYWELYKNSNNFLCIKFKVNLTEEDNKKEETLNYYPYCNRNSIIELNNIFIEVDTIFQQHKSSVDYYIIKNTIISDENLKHDDIICTIRFNNEDDSRDFNIDLKAESGYSEGYTYSFSKKNNEVKLYKDAT